MEVVENDEVGGEEEEEMQREVGEFGNKRENEMTQNENESVCVVVMAVSFNGWGRDIFVSFFS